MGMKFLNKKGWHTGSLRNIENVWKAEQKDEAEKRKLEELRKQIHEERERDEFRQLQEQAGFAPRQERLEFLYDSGLSVGKTSNEGFSALQNCPATQTNSSTPSSAAPSELNSLGPGALFEEKPQSANDAWRKLHSDPLLMIRQREQEALARIKNNPVKMAMILKSERAKMETKMKEDEARESKLKKVKSKHKKHSSKRQSDSEIDTDEDKESKRKSKHKGKQHLDSDEDNGDRKRRHRHSHTDNNSEKQHHDSPRKHRPDNREHLDIDGDLRDRTKHHRHSRQESPVKQKSSRDDRHEHRHSRSNYWSDRNVDREHTQKGNERVGHEKYPSDSRDNKSASKAISVIDSKQTALPPKHDSSRRRGRAPQLSEEERAARLKEMQMDAELHEEQRWKRLKKAEEEDAREASKAGNNRGKSFLYDAHKSVYGAENGGSTTIEESVRRRSHYLQGRTQVDEHNAFRRS